MSGLRLAANEAEWNAIQDVIETTFYTSRGKSGYDRHSPLDKRANNHLLGFWVNQKLIGAVRVDLQEGVAVLRKFAILPAYQHQRFGLLLAKEAESFVAAHGYTLAALGSEPGNVEFFKKAGYEVGAWPRGPEDTNSQPTVDMRKTLTL